MVQYLNSDVIFMTEKHGQAINKTNLLNSIYLISVYNGESIIKKNYKANVKHTV